MAWREPLFLTNDDGIDAAGLHRLIQILHARGHPLAILAPAQQQSASAMRLSLKKELRFTDRNDLILSLDLDPNGPPIRIFSLDGSPCDCTIVAIDQGFESWAQMIRPQLCISGINFGPNISIDVIHSGTVSAAREAALYGMPAIALSLGTYLHEDFSIATEAILELIDRALLVANEEPTNLMRTRGSKHQPWGDEEMPMDERLREAFRSGDIILNLNTPHEWSGLVETVPLGARWYHGATKRSENNLGFIVGAASIEDEPLPRTDCSSLMAGNVVISPLATWPQTHPLNIPDSILHASLSEDADGYPSWLC
ncbi:MAG: 5'/3'-nucleotidase SurE [Candidatus Thalassarchaeaceae archaeon]|nr:5'/3'-nucleotidase SurE [Candidatus Thalassarchaeaceae archaeon]MDP6844004.1 5'/3'-nucleotidase SurE [Candidatus Thalassarchaeaceae archaeon]